MEVHPTSANNQFLGGVGSKKAVKGVLPRVGTRVFGGGGELWGGVWEMRTHSYTPGWTFFNGGLGQFLAFAS